MVRAIQPPLAPPEGMAINAAVFEGAEDQPVLAGALAHLPPCGIIAVSDDAGFLREAEAAVRVSWTEVGFDQETLVAAEVMTALKRRSEEGEGGTALVVDMTWTANKLHGFGNIEIWAAIAEKIADETGVAVVSCYHRDMLIEDQVQVALAAHRQVLARSGIYENPLWLPSALTRAPKDEQASFLLGRIVPDYARQQFFERDDRFAARGANPDWLARSAVSQVAGRNSDAWQIYCFGQLRVYRGNGERIDWKVKGGAARKTRTLFAYLLTSGEKGAHCDRLAELLWPDDAGEEAKRARLHHTIAMLRKALGQGAAVLRTGDYYRLNPPEGSWIDIASFEQMCRRGLSLRKHGQSAEALTIYQTAERLYAGDLFQDIPARYLEDEQEDWCLPRRMWLREMALKLQVDMSAVLRQEGRLRAALEHCQKGLALDPTSDEANMEAIQVFHAQGRPDTMARQYRQYCKALGTIDASPEGGRVQAIFVALTSG